MSQICIHVPDYMLNITYYHKFTGMNRNSSAYLLKKKPKISKIKYWFCKHFPKFLLKRKVKLYTYFCKINSEHQTVKKKNFKLKKIDIITVKESRSGGSTTFQSPEAMTVNDEVMRPETCIGIKSILKFRVR
jgi:hypothetical protein